MDIQSSCIAIFSNYSEAISARQILKKTNLKDNQIMVLDANLERVFTTTSVNYFFNKIGVPKDTMYCYLCQLHSGSILLIVSGTSQEVELTYQMLEKEGYIASVHFNISKTE